MQCSQLYSLGQLALSVTAVTFYSSIKKIKNKNLLLFGSLSSREGLCLKYELNMDSINFKLDLFDQCLFQLTKFSLSCSAS